MGVITATAVILKVKYYEIPRTFALKTPDEARDYAATA